MKVLWSEFGVHRGSQFANEAELEAAVVRLQRELFGADRIYLDVKRLIGARGGQRNIPDGYLLDLGGSKPKLFVVENELSSHDPLRHIAVQLLQFSLAFEAEPRLVRNILLESLQSEIKVLERCQQYAVAHGYRNLDHMLEWLVADSDFTALVIIDEIPEKLEAVLNRKLKFGVEVIELSRYIDPSGAAAYHFEPFLADLRSAGKDEEGVQPGPSRIAVQTDSDELDTIVVPAREDGFQETFLGEDRWYSVRIHASMRDQLRYIAVYRIAPVSAITHIGTIRSMEPWADSGKWVINLAERAQEITGLPLRKNGRVKSLQNLRYANRARLLAARDMDDVWP